MPYEYADYKNEGLVIHWSTHAHLLFSSPWIIAMTCHKNGKVAKGETQVQIIFAELLDRTYVSVYYLQQP